MTLQPYDADRLDQLALKTLDISHILRSMANRVRQDPPGALALHDKKALEWLSHLEHWTQKCEAELEMALIKKRGTRRALKAIAGDSN